MMQISLSDRSSTVAGPPRLWSNLPHHIRDSLGVPPVDEDAPVFFLRTTSHTDCCLSSALSVLTSILYADDAVLLASSNRELQKIVYSLQLVCKEYGMDVNVKCESHGIQ